MRVLLLTALFLVTAVVTLFGMRFGCFAAEVAEEGQEPQPEHVERSQERGENANRPEPDTAVLAGEGAEENFVLAEEATEERRASDGERSHGHRPEGPRHVVAEATHLA